MLNNQRVHDLVRRCGMAESGHQEMTVFSSHGCIIRLNMTQIFYKDSWIDVSLQPVKQVRTKTVNTLR